MERAFPLRRRSWAWMALGLLLAGLLGLAACGESSATPRARATALPRVQAEGPPCRFVYWVPYHNIRTTCIEVVYDNLTPPEAAPALAGLALGPDGALYFARTAFGELWAMRDEDGDFFLDAPTLVAQGLRLPTALTVHEGALIVASVGGLLRLEPDPAGGFGAPEVIVAGLGGDPRFWPGGVRVDGAGRIVVGLGGELVSFAADGSDRRVLARGLRFAADFDWHPLTGDLWIADSRGAGAPYDALLRVPAEALAAGEAIDFGYPACADPSAPGCADSAPAFTFADQSDPAGLAFYPHAGWPFWQDDLIVALGGSTGRVEPSGYAVAAVSFGTEGLPDGAYDLVAPTSENRRLMTSLAGYSLTGRGFYPEHPVDVVVSPEGWLYVAVQEGRIYRLRPRPAAELDQPLTPTPAPTAPAD